MLQVGQNKAIFLRLWFHFFGGYILHSGSIGERGNSILSFYRTLAVLHNSGINLYPSPILMHEEVARCGGLNFLIISDIELFFMYC